ncbi:hypothetical protein GCM10009530_39660 [Microbispora corallina]|uniref:DUF218 domain-containing protein n=1 Tax=Microbispora corallina TaxID=83302 RepID=A0ABQ4G8P8_9ACTN|nr:YdcF family protein [Microbispora corallina]GIH43439.1 hypothetical protein Mco01_64390 [Microbispora corallina]
MPAPSLTPSDYSRLATVMAGPHGAKQDPERHVDLLIVFSCADPEVGRTAARLHERGEVHTILFSGGIGKDSGGLPSLEIPEAVFLASVAMAEGLPAETVVLEQQARNGRENAAYGLRLAHDRGLLAPGCSVAALAPAVRSRRLFEELRFQAAAGGYDLGSIRGLSSGVIDTTRPDVRAELARELNGLHTMHTGDTPRIFPQPDFQPGGEHYDLVQHAGLADVHRLS